MFKDLGSAPNQLTLLRLVIVPFIVIAVVDGRYFTAFLLFVAAGISDGLDGLLARMLGQRTLLGQYLDPIADKLLLSTLFITLSLVHQIPWHVTILVYSRDIGILVISALLYLIAGLRDFRPGIFGKLNTLAQIISVLAVLVVDFHRTQPFLAIRKIGLDATLVLTVASAVQYVVLVERRLKALTHPQPQEQPSLAQKSPNQK